MVDQSGKNYSEAIFPVVSLAAVTQRSNFVPA